MTPTDLASRHPRLYHVTVPDQVAAIRRLGLLSTSRLLDLFEIAGPARDALERTRRSAAMPIRHPRHGTIFLNDQKPLSETALKSCLDDGLEPADWLMMLNRRVFFWATDQGLASLVGARANRHRMLAVIVVDTLALAEAHAERIEISPINSGSTIRKPARRGHSTFTPLAALTYEAWRRQRGQRDAIREVTVLDGVPDIDRFITEIRLVSPNGARMTETSSSVNVRL